jgi:hypothetical protein
LFSWCQRISLGTNKFKQVTEKVMATTNTTCVYDVEKVFDLLLQSNLQFSLYDNSNGNLGLQVGKKPTKVFFATATGMSVIKNETLLLVVLYEDGKYLVNRGQCVPNLI